jgi:Fe-S-cluster containining protein
VLFTDAEMAEMSSALGVGEGEFERLYVWRKYGLRSLRERANYDCVFLDGGGCVIYHARPAQCRRFPFWPEILKNKPSWDFYSRNCPGMDEGDLHDYEAIAGYLSKYEETGGGG